MSLYQKYRPKTFDDVMGNALSIKAMQRLLAKEDHPHVWLFTGFGGCGKTTLARILASAVEGSIIEINSSNNRGIDTAREIIENIQYMPMDGKSIVYILDEFHLVTSQAQNAFLKPLEDTPKYVYFCLCTTNPEKIIAPLKTRCTHIELKRLSDDDVFALLRKVAKAEGIKVHPTIIEKIVEKANGSARDALVKLEKVMYLEDKEEMEKIVSVDSADEFAAIDLCRCLLDSSSNWQDVAQIISNLDTTDYESVRYSVLGYMTSTLLKSGKKRAASIIDSFSEPFYNTNKAGLVMACWNSIRGNDE